MEPILLLHGAISSSKQMLPLKNELDKKVSNVHAFDFPGHGGKGFPDDLFSIRLFAESVLKWMDENKIVKTNIFGYSMGGYVALYMARHYPERINKIITLATKMEWDHFIALDMTRMIDAEKIAAKAPKLANALTDLHHPNEWKEVLHRTTELFLNLGAGPELLTEDFSKINHEVLLLLGDEDLMVTKDETLAASKLMKNSSVKILTETPHPIEMANAEELADLSMKFFS